MIFCSMNSVCEILNFCAIFGSAAGFIGRRYFFRGFLGFGSRKVNNFPGFCFLSLLVRKVILRNNTGFRDGGRVLILVFFLNASSLSAQQNFQALVIGNQNYQQVPLDTPEADAKAMALRLESAGYSVTRLLNAKRSQTYDEIDEFFSRSQHAKVLVFFYAGHAVQLNGRNFIVPVDLASRDDPDVLSKMFDLRYLMNKLTESKAETKIVILDSCRDNIFSSHPGAASGLSELIAPAGTFVAFSTAPGSTAEDGEGENSPYTTALIDALFRPGVKIEDAFKEVRRRVRLMTGNEQTPWESTSLVHDFYMQPSRSEKNKKMQSQKINKSDNLPAERGTRDRTREVRLDQSACARILSKLSLGMVSLSSTEVETLDRCK
jgi:hypothetical protein